jgi:hypothetical protein
MDSSENENDSFEEEKTYCQKEISEHEELKQLYMENEQYVKAKKENEIIEQLKKKIQGMENTKLETEQKKEIIELNSNYDEIIKETRDKYEAKIRRVEQISRKGLYEMNEKYKKDLKNIEKKYAMSKKHSPEYMAMAAEEKKLLKNNRFDEAIALQKLRKKKEEEDNKRYLTLHKIEIENLKKNLTNKYNKEVNNFKNNKKNEIDLLTTQMNITLDNIDKQFNNRRHDLISMQNHKMQVQNNVPFAKGREYKRNNSNLSRSTFKRIMGPMTLSTLKEKNETNKRVGSIGKRIKSAKFDK